MPKKVEAAAAPASPAGKKPDAIVLTPGSMYEIRSLGAKDEPIVTKGTFRGYTQVGNIDGLCIELDASHKELKGKIRVIPSHMVMALDIIAAAPAKAAVPEENIERYYR